MEKKGEVLTGLLRISLGITFLWAFLDKVFGLGFTTAPENSWLSGASPTMGFLANATHGPFASVFQAMAGSVIVDWLFMMGLLLIGTALTFGLATRLASYSGTLLLFLMWLAVLPPEHHPFMDEHIIYALALLLLDSLGAGKYLGMEKWWHSLKIVKKHKILR